MSFISLKSVDRIIHVSCFFEHELNHIVSILTGHKLNIKRLQKKKKMAKSTADTSVLPDNSFQPTLSYRLHPESCWEVPHSSWTFVVFWKPPSWPSDSE